MNNYRTLLGLSHDLITETAKTSKSLREVARRLDMSYTDPRIMKHLREVITEKRVDVSHFHKAQNIRYDRCRYSEQELCDAARASTSWLELMQTLNLCPTGNTKAGLLKKLVLLKVSVAHYAPEPQSTKWTPETTFIVSNFIPRDALRRLARKHVPYVCHHCQNNGEWYGRKLTLELDHKNGNRNDNRKENLRFLCPNCHSQTPTHRGNNIKFQKAPLAQRLEQSVDNR